MTDEPRHPLRAARTSTGQTRSYIVRDADGAFVVGLTFRDVMALVAARAGLIHMRERRRRSYCFVDIHLEPESEIYGLGYGTLSTLQSTYARHALLTAPTEAGPIGLTTLGALILDLIGSLPGAELPTFDLSEAQAA